MRATVCGWVGGVAGWAGGTSCLLAAAAKPAHAAPPAAPCAARATWPPCRCSCWAPRCPSGGPVGMWTRSRLRRRPPWRQTRWHGSRWGPPGLVDLLAGRRRGRHRPRRAHVVALARRKRAARRSPLPARRLLELQAESAALRSQHGQGPGEVGAWAAHCCARSVALCAVCCARPAGARSGRRRLCSASHPACTKLRSYPALPTTITTHASPPPHTTHAGRGHLLPVHLWHGHRRHAGRRPGVCRREARRVPCPAMPCPAMPCHAMPCGLPGVWGSLRTAARRPPVPSTQVHVPAPKARAHNTRAPPCNTLDPTRRWWPTSTTSSASTAPCCAWWCRARPCPRRRRSWWAPASTATRTCSCWRWRRRARCGAAGQGRARRARATWRRVPAARSRLPLRLAPPSAAGARRHARPHVCGQDSGGGVHAATRVH